MNAVRLLDCWVPSIWTVRRVWRETPDTVTVEVRAENGTRFRFHPGQFNMLSLPDVGEVPISISGSPHRPHVVAHTIRAVGMVTRALARVRRGDRIGLRGPFGRGWPMDRIRGRDLVLVAGGLGLAPLRPVVYRVAACRNRLREVVLLYGARTPADLLYRSSLLRWSHRYRIRVWVTVDRPDAAWTGHVGVVTSLFRFAKRYVQPDRVVAFLCGPEMMMRFAVQELHRMGVPDTAIYLSLERNMQCAIGFCGHCQFGPYFMCRDGPVFQYAEIAPWWDVREF